ncbi:MAG: hypothetical protein M3Z36_03730 [Acidobacteriota bacterium]|nr:hypothetical protein [Acidobacteriota bacterium]
MATSTVNPSDVVTDELQRLFRVFRTSNLNVRYYGVRAEMLENKQRRLDLVCAALSFIALGILLLSNTEPSRWFAAAVAGLAGILTGLSPLLKWTEKSKHAAFLYRSHQLIFGEVERAIMDIRRDGLTEEHLGASKLVIDLFGRLESQDEQEEDTQLKDRLDQEVRVAFPPEYLWTGF